jgi:glycosyltransferase involved in cell wall biosynthesis
MATYNGARFIGEQLESLARQTVLPSELVVTDDGSTDDTLAIVEAFAARAPFPVRIEKNPKNLGYPANFMKAASLCTSEYIAFCDQDDIWLPHKLEACLAAFDSEDVLCVYHDANVVSVDLTPLGTLDKAKHIPLHPVNPPLSIEPWKYGPGFTQVQRRSLLAFSGYWPQSGDCYNATRPASHDQWFFFLASCLGTVRYIAEPLALYRRHESNTTPLQDNSYIAKWNNLLATSVAGIRSREIAAGKRASILERIAAGPDYPHRERAQLAAALYRTFQARYNARQKLYTSGSIFSRLRQFIALSAKGGYRSREKWGVGRKALVRDIVCGVLFPAKINSSGH